MVDHEPLQAVLTRSRVAPDYTMGTLADRTGIHPDTLRTWERRYGFPNPERTPGRHRLYSERDIAAIEWVRAQTRNGLRLQQAIAMVREALAQVPDTPPPSVPVPPPVSTAPSPLETFISHLATGDLAAARQTWDDLAVTISVASIGERVIIPALRQLTSRDAAALAFLERKATVLLDAALPEEGDAAVAIAIDDAPQSRIAATVLAAALARAGMRVHTPFAATDDMSSITRLRQLTPHHLIVVHADGAGAALMESLRAVSGAADVIAWSPFATDASAADIPTILASILGR